MMGVIKEFRCKTHGEFESSHPICPNFGCESEHVERVFLTAVSIGSASTRRTDAGIRKTVDDYKLGNLRSARAGQASYGGDLGKALGTELLWGDEVQKRPEFKGMSFDNLTTQAQQPFVVTKRDGSVETLTHNNGMRDAANTAGLTKRRLPVAERTIAKVDIK